MPDLSLQRVALPMGKPVKPIVGGNAPVFTGKAPQPRFAGGVPLSTGTALGRLLKNIGRTIAAQSEAVLQNPAAFKNNALVLSSLILVISRIVVASISAVKARGTSDADYRYQESIRTGIREVGGFTSSFGLLLAISTAMKSAMRKSWGMPDEPSYPFIGNLKKSFQRWKDPDFQLKQPNYHLDESFPFSYSPEKAAGFMKKVNGLRGMLNHEALTGAREKAFLSATYTWAPIVGAGSVALYVSGKLLEKFTKRYSGTVVNWLSRRSGASPAPAQNKDQHGSQPSPPIAAAMPANSFANPSANLAANPWVGVYAFPAAGGMHP